MSSTKQRERAGELHKMRYFERVKEKARLFRSHWFLFRKYGTPFPTSLELPHTTNRIYVNCRENRGRAIFQCAGTGQPHLKAVWRELCNALEPTLVLDIGVNYGEFLFSMNYPTDAQLLGIEANPELIGYLDQSRDIHPNKSQIELINALAAEKSLHERRFFIDRRWSGTSSALKLREDSELTPVSMQCIAIDDLVAEIDLSTQRIVFKVDVEGYEPYVIAGMDRILSEAGKWAGLIEFNSGSFERSGADMRTYLDRLVRNTTIWAIDHRGLADIVTPLTLEDWISSLSEGREVSLDLLVLSHGLDFAYIRELERR